jgi:hypothetical protein
MTSLIEKMTTHAEIRHQQRAIPTIVTSLIMDYGASMYHKGAEVRFLDKQGRRRLKKALGGDRNLGVIERWLNSYVVVGDNAEVITVARRRHRLRHP